ncbi:MAG: hypothetical protein GX275_08155 [Clostridiales bacterium]|nr:hypothetical protein [Clostridiales bacterium]
MKNILFALEELLKKPLYCVFTIMQLVISFILIFLSIYNTNSINEKTDFIKKTFQDKNYYILDVSKMVPLEQVSLEKLQEFYGYMKNNVDIYSVNSETVLISAENLPTSFLVEFENHILENEQFQRVKSLKVNEEYINSIGINISQGDFKKGDEKYTYVLLGDNYKDIYKINDVIPYSFNDDNSNEMVKNYKVSAFINKDSVVCIGGDLDNVININDYIIEVNNNNFSEDNTSDDMIKKGSIYNFLSGGYFDIKDNSQVEKINNLGEELSLNYKLISVDTKLDEFQKNYMPLIMQMKALSVIILFFTSISITIVMLNTIINNLKQYAINMLVGASTRDIILRIFYEIAILFIASLVLSLFIIYKFIVSDNIVQMKFNDVSQLIILAIIICIIVSLIPIRKFKKLSINNMIKGGE